MEPLAALPIFAASQVPILASASTSGNQALILAAVVGAAGTIIAAILITRRSSKQQLQSIEVKVDGRLEAALEKIDRLEGALSGFTGVKPPPLVAGGGKPSVETVVQRANDVPIVEAPVVVVDPTK